MSTTHAPAPAPAPGAPDIFGDLPPPCPRGRRIHPSAWVHHSAELGEGVILGAGARVGPNCVVGDRTVLHPGAFVVSHTTLGADNAVHPYAVLGGDPQDRAYKPEHPGRVIVGDRNIFREYVSVSRSTGEERPTRIGNGCMFMANSHAGHNAIVGDNVVLVNSAVLAGWTEVGNNSTLSGYAGVHQFCRVGEGVILQGSAIATKHVPPFTICSGFNQIAGLNRVGIRRNPALSAQDRTDIREAFRAFYSGCGVRPFAERIAALESLTLQGAGERFRAFILLAANETGRFRRGVAPKRTARTAHVAGDAEE